MLAKGGRGSLFVVTWADLKGFNQGAFLYLFNPLLYRHGIDRMSRPIHKKIYLNFEKKKSLHLCFESVSKMVAIVKGLFFQATL